MKKHSYMNQIEQKIAQNRKKLDDMRLHHESQNTKLLKIQQQEREVDKEYELKKRKNAETIKELAEEEEVFEKEQEAVLREFQEQRELIVNNEKKRKNEVEKKNQLVQIIKDRTENINKKLQEVQEKKDIETRLKQEIEQHRIYEEFLKRVMVLEEQTGGEGDELNVQPIIDRYTKLTLENQKYKEERLELQKRKSEYLKEQQKEKNAYDDKVLTQTSELNELKASIEKLNQANLELQNEIEEKISENNSRMVDYCQIIFCIKNLHAILRQTYPGYQPPREGPDNTNSVLEKLYLIKEFYKLYLKADDKDKRKKDLR